MDANQPDRADVIFPPPFIYIAALIAGFVLHRLFPLRVLPTSLARPLGWVCVAAGVVAIVTAARAMLRARTTIDPFHPTTAIVSDGPFRYSRNPIYLGLTLGYIGVALLRNALAPLVLLPVVLAVVQRGVIEREERYLERKFGATYTDYKARARRWI